MKGVKEDNSHSIQSAQNTTHMRQLLNTSSLESHVCTMQNSSIMCFPFVNTSHTLILKEQLKLSKQ